MSIHPKYRLLALIVLLSVRALATDGYFSIGYGVKQLGQGGAGVALPQDGLAAATNPAGMVFVGDRFDFGLTWFRPIRGASIIGSEDPALDGNFDGSRKKSFFIPELGYNHLFSPRLSIGLSAYGNGGMNTAYTTAIPLFSANPTFRAGVDLQQLFVSPTVAFKANPHNAFGLALNIGYQKFAAQGLENFEAPGFSTSPGNLTELGFSNSFGAGVRVGWLGTVTQALSVGATFQTKTYMQKLDKYKGLFAEQGGFDIPANVAGGVAFKVVSKATLLFDVERIFYGQVSSIADPDFPDPPTQLGANNGPGFGWHDINAEKLGFDFKAGSNWMLRTGFNHSGLPFDASQNFFNILAPAVVQNHLTVGATWGFGNDKEINIAFQHAFAKKFDGVNSIPPGSPPQGFGGGEANLRMYQDAVSISIGWGK